MPTLLREYAALCRQMALVTHYAGLRAELLQVASEMEEHARLFEREAVAQTASRRETSAEEIVMARHLATPSSDHSDDTISAAGGLRPSHKVRLSEADARREPMLQLGGRDGVDVVAGVKAHARAVAITARRRDLTPVQSAVLIEAARRLVETADTIEDVIKPLSSEFAEPATLAAVPKLRAGLLRPRRANRALKA